VSLNESCWIDLNWQLLVILATHDNYFRLGLIANKSDISTGKALTLYCDQDTFMLLHVKLNVVSKFIIRRGHLQNTKAGLTTI